jgi:hypothetical protein
MKNFSSGIWLSAVFTVHMYIVISVSLGMCLRFTCPMDILCICSAYLEYIHVLIKMSRKFAILILDRVLA